MMFLVVILVVFIIGILILISRYSGRTSMPIGCTDDDIRRIGQEGKKIEAIQWYRNLHKVGLKKAKQAVEEMIDEK
ncbi:hypothetical protein [uncultured Desulfobacter sp.]|uniref:hypothetical protein n=1 Tax=uncultured Desulfobacter sp. TaxID=240139 RepID=UPI0029F5AC3F|nr:hypothetical protein [uncultured Desulfobacter sp.]